MAVGDGIGGGPVRDPFPGVRLPDGTGAPGSSGASGQAADDTPAGQVTRPDGSWQAGARFSAGTSGTVEPGQPGTSAISPGPAADYTSTGAGGGSASHYPRRPWQQSTRG